jgi:hypothetical protein
VVSWVIQSTFFSYQHFSSCFFGELLLGKPLFPGAKESQQLEFIYDKCGSPEEETWPGVKSLPFFSELGPKKLYQRNLLSYMRLHRQKLLTPLTFS